MSEVRAFIQPGETIGPYRVLKISAFGGMAQICEVEVREKYRTEDMPACLALKVADDELQHALVAEADYLMRFDHPNVVKIYPLLGYHKTVYAAKEEFETGWHWYYAMELLDGGSLEHRLTRPTTLTTLANAINPPQGWERPLSLAAAVGVTRQLIDALDHIHQRSVINLDVKPSNILFRNQSLGFLKTSVPEIVLSDFGIARDPSRPRFGLLGVATPEYVSPEHAREMQGELVPLDGRSDLFSLGVVMYEILTGELPFENLGQLVDPTFTPVPPRDIRSSIPEKLEAMVMRALAKSPDYRYQSAQEMRVALDEVEKVRDWGVVMRRMFTGVAITGLVAGGILGGRMVWEELNDIAPAPTPSAPSVVVTDTPTPVASATPSGTPEAPPSPAPGLQSTSTPRPTFTPTATVPPRTATPTPTDSENN